MQLPVYRYVIDLSVSAHARPLECLFRSRNFCKMSESQVRQNYHAESEEGVNKQINLELYAMYTYLSMVDL